MAISPRPSARASCSPKCAISWLEGAPWPGPPLILVVDDTPENLEIVTRRLESQSYAVAVAADGEEALAQVASLRPDLILLDVMMPKLDGIAVTRRLKADATL